MNSYKIFTLCLIVCMCIELGKSVPTFGNEFVHIKVHVPKEADSHVHSLPQSLPAHKVVTHHYHRRRRPSIIGGQSKHNALLESIILSEVNKPTISSDHLEYINHGGEIAEHISKPLETYLVKQEHMVRPKKVNTYTVVEETKKIPDDHYSEHEHEHEHEHGDHHGYTHEEDHVDTFKVVDIKPSYHSSAVENYRYGSRVPGPRVETFKVVDQHIQDQRDHDHYTKHKRPHIDTLKITQSHEHRHYDHKHAYETDDDYHYHTAVPPQRPKAVKIVETEVPTRHSYKHYGHYNAPSSHTESIEIVKTKAPVESSNSYSEHYHNDGTYLQVKPDGGFEYARPASGSSSHSNHQPQHNGGYSSPFQSKPKYAESYQYEHATDDIAYALGQEEYLPTDSYIPAKIVNSQSSYHNRDNVKKNTLFNDEVLTRTGAETSSDISNGYKYNRPKPSVDTEWPPRGNGYNASETYVGIDSYSVGHVQGVGSGGYSYPSPYP